MKNRDYRMFLEDIIQLIIKIQSYKSGLSYDNFIQNGLVFDAVIRNLAAYGRFTEYPNP